MLEHLPDPSTKGWAAVNPVVDGSGECSSIKLLGYEPCVVFAAASRIVLTGHSIFEEKLKHWTNHKKKQIPEQTQ